MAGVFVPQSKEAIVHSWGAVEGATMYLLLISYIHPDPRSPTSPSYLLYSPWSTISYLSSYLLYSPWSTISYLSLLSLIFTLIHDLLPLPPISYIHPDPRSPTSPPISYTYPDPRSPMYWAWEMSNVDQPYRDADDGDDLGGERISKLVNRGALHCTSASCEEMALGRSFSRLCCLIW